MTIASPPTPAQAYEDYFVPAIFSPLASVLLDHAAPRPGEAVVDIACGTGIVTRRAAEAVGAQARVVGLDVNPGMLEVARTLTTDAGLGVEWREGDATAMDLPDASFELLLCQQGLQFLPDRAAGAAEMRRVLTGDGRAVVAVWQGLEHHPLFAALAEAEIPHLERHGVPVTYDDAVAPFSLGASSELVTLLRSSGFGAVEVSEASIVARFPAPETFVERLEYAYAAVVPAFVRDPDAFATYLAAIQEETSDLVDAYRDGDHIAVPMHANIAVARP